MISLENKFLVDEPGLWMFKDRSQCLYCQVLLLWSSTSRRSRGRSVTVGILWQGSSASQAGEFFTRPHHQQPFVWLSGNKIQNKNRAWWNNNDCNKCNNVTEKFQVGTMLADHVSFPSSTKDRSTRVAPQSSWDRSLLSLLSLASWASLNSN